MHDVCIIIMVLDIIFLPLCKIVLILFLNRIFGILVQLNNSNCILINAWLVLINIVLL